MRTKEEYQEALDEIKTLLIAMQKEDDNFEYHYYVHVVSINKLQELIDNYEEKK